MFIMGQICKYKYIPFGGQTLAAKADMVAATARLRIQSRIVKVLHFVNTRNIAFIHRKI